MLDRDVAPAFSVNWEELSKDGGLGVGKILLMVCCEQEEGQLPIPFISQLCTIFLFPIPFLPFASLPFPALSPPPRISLLLKPFFPHFLFHSNPISYTHTSFFLSISPPLPFLVLLPALPSPPPSLSQLLGKKTI